MNVDDARDRLNTGPGEGKRRVVLRRGDEDIQLTGAGDIREVRA